MSKKASQNAHHVYHEAEGPQQQKITSGSMPVSQDEESSATVGTDSLKLFLTFNFIISTHHILYSNIDILHSHLIACTSNYKS